MDFKVGEVVEVIPRRLLMRIDSIANDRALCAPLTKGKGKAEWYPVTDLKKHDRRPLKIFFT
ncbi:hypothetical protein [Sphingobium sp. EM0848]|uniref:hypothetical protein n=1 Tax=Sphingobium sp. EM0848 TaxID=2743473 RepID=UPI00159CAE2B|nr:hypothetical protein [Sphingobium sp. EM0848]